MTSTTLESIRALAAARIVLCDMYISRNARCLRGQQWVVASTMWNRRIVHSRVVDGQNVMALAPCDMPTSYSRKDADSLAAELNADTSRDEKVVVIHDTAWWEKEKAEALAVVNA